MMTLTIDLPDNIARKAKDAGLLTPDALAQLLKETMRRQAGRHLLEVAKRIQATGTPPMSDEEIVAEVKAVRAERRARQAKDDNAGRS
ncbi:MAG: hypothetical protein KZQ89_21690 [Candidatus Thiodiazotropha sp. (ex Lucinoma kastoroae)]|nr:hypothetical protein [Candidatus Thiodiazotropha sp. (ex Lucinoma kastoroae)]